MVGLLLECVGRGVFLFWNFVVIPVGLDTVVPGFSGWSVYVGS